jgi:elongation factor G
MRQTVVTYANDQSGKYTESAPTGELADQIQRLHSELIELVAESDDSLLEKFLEKGNLTEEEMRGGVHAAFQQGNLIPVFCAAGERNVGVARLMDFIAKYASSPMDRPVAKGLGPDNEPVEVRIDDSQTVLHVFKTLNEQHIGEMSFFRVYSGTARFGADMFNASRNITERIGQIFILNGKNRENVNSLVAGDLGAVVKLKNTHTGDTLCSPGLNVRLPAVQFPKPSIHAALKLKAKGEEDKVAQGLAAISAEDPTFSYQVDAELHQTVLSGQGELHLQVVSEQLKNRYKVDFDLVAPKIRFAKQFVPRATPNTGTRSKPAAQVSSPRCGCASNQNRVAQVSSSLKVSPAKTWTECSFLLSRRALTPRVPRASSPVTG